MKNYQQVESQKPGAKNQRFVAPFSLLSRPSALGSRPGFTLIELLVVISIIAVIAAFTIPVFGALKKQNMKKQAAAELELVATAIDRYHATYGFYPPSNTNNVVTNQLYYELEGTTNTGTSTSPIYQTLDGASSVGAVNYNNTFYVGGVVNYTKGGGDEDVKAKNFLSDLKPGQIATNGTVSVLVSAVSGLDPTYQPMPGFTSGTGNNANPIRYNSSNPTNNPNSYDLWIQLKMSGQTYLICNWSKQVQVNNPLP